jgi:sulfite reductase alpha subunit-like flavoprotein
LYSYFSKNKERYFKKRQEVENCFENSVPEYETQMIDSSETGKIKNEHQVNTEDYEYFLKRYYNSTFVMIESIQELRKSNKNGSTLRVVYDLSNSSDITYKVADNIGIYPTNSEASVITVAQKLKFDLSKVIIVKKLFPEVKKKISLPSEMTVKDILLHVVDLSGPIR